MATATQPPIVCPGHLRPVVDVRYSKPTDEGVFLISACHDKNPMLRWGDNGDWIGTFAGHKGAVWSACLNNTATQAATASADFSAKLWDAVSGKCMHTFDHKHIVKVVDFDEQGKRLMTAGHEKKTRIFDLEQYEKDPIIFDLSTVIRTATWQENSNSILCGGADGTVRVWDVRSGKESNMCQVSDHEIQDLELSPDGKLITVASGKTISFYDASTYALVKKHDLEITVEAASLHPDGKHFVTGGSDLWVHVIDFETGEEIECNKGHHGPVFCIRYAPDGKSYASGSEDGTIRIWKDNQNTKES